MNPPPTLTIRFTPLDEQSYRLRLDHAAVGECQGSFHPPCDPATWAAVMQALEPGFVLPEADEATQAALAG